MLDIADQLSRWCEQGRAFAVATVVAVHGSAPRQPGAALAVDVDGAVIGSVSGGCVEAAVYDLCREALASATCTLQRFGYSDEDAFAVGLTCGGVLDIFVQPVIPTERAELVGALATAAAADAVAVARVVRGPADLMGGALFVRADGSCAGGFGDPALEATARAEATVFLDTGRTGTIEIGARGSRCGEPLTLLVESIAPTPRMLVFGAIDFAAALVRIGKYLGYHVTVCDARPLFVTPARFPEADEVVADWPHRYLESQALDGRTVICALTHDAKFDIPLLQRALRLPIAYIGAMGSRRTHLQRLGLLRESGVTEAELARLHSPIGLALGARTPEETAVSIAAEIVAHRRGGSGRPLTHTEGPIHRATTSQPSNRALLPDEWVTLWRVGGRGGWDVPRRG
ncbi:MULTISPECIES: XdhC family protein [Streptomyces]|uniref:XdhC family protein n=1 Tax=Streptomyces kaempferi TaxID=333725 RepID=A0ABW3XVM9_9ACTN|nr:MULTISPECIES: XdhC/CoxI family protein [unclassified Streptomyces]QIY66921.1 XdhC family protein [Streptomyces sp. RPA4-2]